MHWDQKIEAKASVESESIVKDKPTLKEEKNSPKTKRELMKLTKNLDQAVINQIESAIDKQKQLQLVIVGSTSTPETNGWPSLLKKQIEAEYGKELIKVTVKEIPGKTSTEVVNEELYKEINELKPDVLLYEPFFLYDNGVLITTEKRLENLSFMLGEFKSENPEIVTILQPANPLYNAIHYPKEVTELMEYAVENDVIYLNHWEVWPNLNSEEMNDYVIQSGEENSGQPTEAGHQLWADYLIDYFIANTDENE